MPSVLSDDDKETVKRAVPKAANKILTVAVARLYVAYPNRQRWTYTGIQGAAVLANDLVGNTFWIKMVDISPASRGVIWDQEIYEAFSYNQDRTFFHTFELEQCLAGLSFLDEKEAKKFKKKMDEREKDASKATKATPFGSAGGAGQSQGQAPNVNGTRSSRLGGFGSLLHPHRSVSQPPQAPPTSILPPRAPEPALPAELDGGDNFLDSIDPAILLELKEMGITEDLIEDNADFIKGYIAQQQDGVGESGQDTDVAGSASTRDKAPPPLPAVPPGAGRTSSLSPQNTGSTTASRRGPAPALPPSRRSRPENHSAPSPPHPSSPEPSPVPRFRAPPPIADAGKYANADPVPPPPPPRQSGSSTSGPPPPPRPPKEALDEPSNGGHRFSVPPPFSGERPTPSAPPLPPPRNSVASVASGREASHAAPPPGFGLPPPLPPKNPNGPAPSSSALPPPPLPPTLPSASSRPSDPPPLPTQGRASAAPAAPPLPAAPRPPAQLPSTTGGALSPPPPPPLPSGGGPPAPPPPPPPNRDSGYQSGVPSAPPLPPGRDSSGPSAPLPQPSGGKEDVLKSIRASGGIGGGALKKVDPSLKRDRSSAMASVGAGASGGNADPGSAAPSAGGEAGLAGALAAALSKRKTRVSQSDDEDDDDEWDEPAKPKK